MPSIPLKEKPATSRLETISWQNGGIEPKVLNDKKAKSGEGFAGRITSKPAFRSCPAINRRVFEDTDACKRERQTWWGKVHLSLSPRILHRIFPFRVSQE